MEGKKLVLANVVANCLSGSEENLKFVRNAVGRKGKGLLGQLHRQDEHYTTALHAVCNSSHPKSLPLLRFVAERCDKKSFLLKDSKGDIPLSLCLNGEAPVKAETIFRRMRELDITYQEIFDNEVYVEGGLDNTLLFKAIVFRSACIFNFISQNLNEKTLSSPLKPSEEIPLCVFLGKGMYDNAAVIFERMIELGMRRQEVFNTTILTKDGSESTVLFEFIAFGSASAVKLISKHLGKKILSSPLKPSEETPLYVCLSKGMYDNAAVVLERMIERDIPRQEIFDTKITRNGSENTVLFEFIAFGSASAVKLVSKHLSKNMLSSLLKPSEETPLCVFLGKGMYDNAVVVLERMIEFGMRRQEIFDTTILTKNGSESTVLFEFIAFGSASAVKLVSKRLSKKILSSPLKPSKETPLYVCLSKGMYDNAVVVLERMIECGMRLQEIFDAKITKNGSESTVLFEFIASGSASVVELISKHLDENILLSPLKPSEETPLCVCLGKGMYDNAVVVLEKMIELDIPLQEVFDAKITKNGSKSTVLFEFIASGSASVVKLVSKHLDENMLSSPLKPSKETPLCVCLGKGMYDNAVVVLERMIECGMRLQEIFDAKITKNGSESTVLFEFIAFGNVGVVKLVSKHLDENMLSSPLKPSEETPLCVCLGKGMYDNAVVVLERMIECGMRLQEIFDAKITKNGSESTVLFEFIAFGNVGVVKLVSKHLDENMLSSPLKPSEETPLYVCLSKGMYDNAVVVLERMIELDIPLQEVFDAKITKNGSKSTVLFEFIASGSASVVKLVSKHLDENMLSSPLKPSKETPLYVCLSKGMYDNAVVVLERMIELDIPLQEIFDAKITKNGLKSTVLFEFIAFGSASAVELISKHLDENILLSPLKPSEETPLCVCLSKEKHDNAAVIFERIIELGISLQEVFDAKITKNAVLFEAIAYGNAIAVELISKYLDKKMFLSPLKPSKETPLCVCLGKGMYDNAVVVLKRMIELDISLQEVFDAKITKNGLKSTVLFEFIASGSASVVKLISKYLDENMLSSPLKPSEETPLCVCLGKGMYDNAVVVLERMIECGMRLQEIFDATILTKNGSKSTVLFEFIVSGNVGVVKLVSKHLDENMLSSPLKPSEDTPLCVCLRRYMYDNVEVIFERMIELDISLQEVFDAKITRYNLENTVLFEFIVSENVDFVRFVSRRLSKNMLSSPIKPYGKIPLCICLGEYMHDNAAVIFERMIELDISLQEIFDAKIIKDGSKSTVLFEFIAYGSASVVKLISKHLDEDMLSSPLKPSKETPLCVCLSERNYGAAKVIFERMIEFGMRRQEILDIEMSHGLHMGCTQTVRAFLQKIPGDKKKYGADLRDFISYLNNLGIDYYNKDTANPNQLKESVKGMACFSGFSNCKQ